MGRVAVEICLLSHQEVEICLGGKLTLRPATVFFPRFPATGGVKYPHTVNMIIYAIGDRYRLAVKKNIAQK